MTETERQLYAMGETIRQLTSQHNGLLVTVRALQQQLRYKASGDVSRLLSDVPHYVLIGAELTPVGAYHNREDVLYRGSDLYAALVAPRGLMPTDPPPTEKDDFDARMKRFDTWFDRSPLTASQTWGIGTRELCERAYLDGCAAERQQATAQQEAKDAEIVALKRDVAFKDSLIWTSRESELYKATVAAEKAQKQAEAEVASLTQHLDAAFGVVQTILGLDAAGDDPDGLVPCLTVINQRVRGLQAQVAALTQQLDTELHRSPDYWQTIETQRAELIALRGSATL